MNTLKLGIRNDQSAFCPGDRIEGAAGWNLDTPPKAVEVRLFWQTRGKGTEDLEIVDRVRFDQPGMQGAQPFSFTAPELPCSFSGKLISVIWAIELVVSPGNLAARETVVIAPEGREIVLGSV